MKLIKSSIKHIFPQHYLFYLSLLIILGFVFATEYLDYGEMKTSGEMSIMGRALRVTTISIAGFASFLALCLTRKLGHILQGHLAFFFCYFCMASLSIIYSQYWQMTAFKSFEIITIVFVAATLYMTSNPVKISIQYVHFIFIIFVLFALSTWIQFAIFGVEVQREIVHDTPFFNFMLSSQYPFMAGNAVGYLGALVCLFGLYLTDILKHSRVGSKALGGGIALLGFITTIFSYTRSVLLFLICTIALYWFLCRKNKYLIFVSISVALIFLCFPQIYQNLLLHLQRGDSLDALRSMSGRTDLWGSILKDDITNLLLGQGFGTGSLFRNFAQSGQILASANVHNTLLEIINFTGFTGLTIWLCLMASLGKKLCLFYRQRHAFCRKPDAFLHNFIFCVFILSLCRAMMNVTFVRLDLFMFILLAIILYCDNLPSFSEKLK